MTHAHSPVTAAARDKAPAAHTAAAPKPATASQRLRAAFSRIGNTNAHALLGDCASGSPVCPVDVGRRAPGVQAKLTMSRPGDADEREADRVADHIMSSNSSSPAPCASCSASGSSCSKCAQEKKIQRKALPGSGPATAPAVTGLRGGGAELAPPVRSFFEPHFGADLSNVRVHTDANAGRAARSISARAFTLGSDIAFAPGQFAPNSDTGRRLLAHELTHVLQQSDNDTAQHISREPVGDTVVPAPPPLPADPASKVPEAPSQVPAVPPDGETMTFEGVVLATNAAYVIPVMRDYIAKHGEDGAREFRDRLREHISDHIPDADKTAVAVAGELKTCVETPVSNDARIWAIVNESLEQIFTDNKKWMDDFEAKTHEIVLGMLKESEDRVLEEKTRYGIGYQTVERTRYRMTGRGGMVPYQASVTEYSMQDSPGSRALAEAATGLLARKKKFDAADKALKDFAEDENMGAFGELAHQRLAGWDPQLQRLSELRAVWQPAKRDLDVFRMQKSAEFPILAAYASDEEISEDKLATLQELANGKSPAATNLMGEEVKTRLEHIDEVRDDITNHNGKKTKIWQVPRIIEGTRAATGAMAGTMWGRLVDDKVKDEAPGIWTSILIGLLQLVLVLAAPFTAGLTLIPAAAISGYQAYTHFKEYERAQMLHGTDFGALALSSEEPSLFWLAVDIIGAGFDVGAAAGAALSVFRALAPAARAARAAQLARDAEALEQAAQNLERAATTVGGPALARTVGRDVRMGAVAMEVGETAEEAGALARTGETMAASETRAAAGAVETETGRLVKVSEGGTLWSCSSPCTTMRERYKDLLHSEAAAEKKWLARLNEIEADAAKIPKGKEGVVARGELAKRAANLENEMRTTVQPGAWKIPDHDPAKFADMVRRRGSVAAELDHHPKYWTGSDEAKFRYGMDVEAEPGYRFMLDEHGTLHYQGQPPKRFNPETKLFDDIGEAGKFHRAQWGTESPTSVAKLPEAQRHAVENAFAQRGKFMARRDVLEELPRPLTKAQNDELGKIYAQINEQSRQMGEQAAEGIMREKQGAAKLYPLDKGHSTSGDFDQVWKTGERFQLVEGKGGSSGLGSRSIGEGARAEQGTIEYAKSIAKNMSVNGPTKKIRDLGAELLIAIDEGKVDYVLVRAPIGEKAGKAVIKDIQVSQFVLTPP